MENNNLSIKLLQDCWGSESYFGYKDNKQYTESYDTIEELREENPEFENCVIQFKNNADKLIKITDNNNLITTSIIDRLKEHLEPIYFNDLSCKHFMFDFQIDNIRLESININNELTVIELNAYN